MTEEQKIQNTETNETKEDGKMIRISKEADKAICELLQRTNESTENCRITKSAVASYILEQNAPKFGDTDIKTLYMKSVSDVDLLRSALKQAAQSGVIPDNLRNILFANAGLTPSATKVKKPRRADSISDTIKNKDAA